MQVVSKTDFLTKLKNIQLDVFPSLDLTSKITGQGLNRNNGFVYKRKNGEGAKVTLPFNDIYNTYEHFCGKTNISSNAVRIYLDKYKLYDTFWMALMLHMELATRVSDTNNIDM